MKTPLMLLVCLAAFVSVVYCETPDVLTIPPDLKVPKVTTGKPAPGKRVLQALPQYENSDVRHALYLPTDWEEGKTYPVLVEYTGNNGTVRGGKACQGYGISGGKEFLWVCLPYVSEDGKNDMDWWWGDPDRTAVYAKAAITAVCEKWGGDPKAVILTGYSRGAIACNYIGLRNDDIAGLWLGMVPASHYDNRRWGMSPAEFQRGPQRLRRLGDTPQYVCGEHHLATRHTDPKLLKMMHDRKIKTFETAKKELNIIPMTHQERIREFITQNHPAANITYADFPWVNHTGDWILRDTRERRKLRGWVQNLLAKTSDAEAITILTLGDSITSRGDSYRSVLVPALKDKGVAHELIGPNKDSLSRHAGYGGRNTKYLLSISKEIYRKYPADIVMIHSGHNSFSKDKPVPGIIRDTKAIIATFRSINPKVTILLAQSITAGKLPKYSYLPELNGELEKLSKRLESKESKVILVNQADGFDWKTDTIRDKVHPNASGAKKMAGKWMEALLPLLRR